MAKQCSYCGKNMPEDMIFEVEGGYLMCMKCDRDGPPQTNSSEPAGLVFAQIIVTLDTMLMVWALVNYAILMTKSDDLASAEIYGMVGVVCFVGGFVCAIRCFGDILMLLKRRTGTVIGYISSVLVILGCFVRISGWFVTGFNLLDALMAAFAVVYLISVALMAKAIDQAK